VGIHLKSVKQFCCDDTLSSFRIIDIDPLDDVGSTCDKVIECQDKYILVEEKSILLGFLNNCCTYLDKDFDSYKYVNDDIEYLKITELFLLIQTLDVEVKKRLLEQTKSDLLSSAPKKASNTTYILCEKFDSTKAANMSVYYLYCKSGKPIDRIIYNWLARNRKNIFVECQDLKVKLEKECA